MRHPSQRLEQLGRRRTVALALLRRWQPELLDYIYVSYTNSSAFSPTDVLPLTRRTKLLMLSESAVSAVTLLLVAARAVNSWRERSA